MGWRRPISHRRGIAVGVAAMLLVAGGGGTLLDWFAESASGRSPVGVQRARSGTYDGYTLFAPHTLTTTYLVDMDGDVVHTWESSYRPGLAVRLLDDGDLLRPAQLSTRGPFADGGGRGGQVDRIAWDGSLVWSIRYGTDTTFQHHDVELLPNGNVLLIAWEYKTPSEAIAAGRDSSNLLGGAVWPDTIVEIEPMTNAIVWEWHAWDHLVQDRSPTKPGYGVVAERPGRIDVNYVTKPDNPDWMHSNSLDYDPVLDRILLSVREFDEIWVIDHATTTEEARGPRGDLLFRWGNPAAYDRGTGVDRKLFRQHNAEWVPAGLPGAGSITVFNNGVGRGYSTSDEITPVLRDGRFLTDSRGRFLPETSTTTFGDRAEDRFYSELISGTQRLGNGDTLVTDGAAGRVVEVDPRGRVVWEYYSPYTADPDKSRPTRFFRAQRYGYDYPGLRGTGLDR